MTVGSLVFTYAFINIIKKKKRIAMRAYCVLLFCCASDRECGQVSSQDRGQI